MEEEAAEEEEGIVVEEDQIMAAPQEQEDMAQIIGNMAVVTAEERVEAMEGTAALPSDHHMEDLKAMGEIAMALLLKATVATAMEAPPRAMEVLQRVTVVPQRVTAGIAMEAHQRAMVVIATGVLQRAMVVIATGVLQRAMVVIATGVLPRVMVATVMDHLPKAMAETATPPRAMGVIAMLVPRSGQAIIVIITEGPVSALVDTATITRHLDMLKVMEDQAMVVQVMVDQAMVVQAMAVLVIVMVQVMVVLVMVDLDMVVLVTANVGQNMPIKDFVRTNTMVTTPTQATVNVSSSATNGVLPTLSPVPRGHTGNTEVKDLPHTTPVLPRKQEKDMANPTVITDLTGVDTVAHMEAMVTTRDIIANTSCMYPLAASLHRQIYSLTYYIGNGNVSFIFEILTFNDM